MNMLFGGQIRWSWKVGGASEAVMAAEAAVLWAAAGAGVGGRRDWVG